MHDNSGILFILPLQTSVSWAERLYQALLDLDRFSLQQQTTHQTQASFYCRTIPRQCYPLQEAFYREKQQLPWREATGAIAGQFILRYPPGIPLLVPGEMITREIVQLWLASGGTEDELVTVLAQ